MSDTKKLDKALLKAIRIAEVVAEDRFDEQTGAGYASAEAVLLEGRRALAEAGLVLWPIDWEHVQFNGRACLVRVALLKHVKSGEAQELRSPPFPLVADRTPPALATGGLATLSLRYLVRDLLMLPTEEPAPLRKPTQEQTEALDRMLANSKPAREVREQTAPEVLRDIEALLFDADPEVAKCARAEIVGADIVRLRATRDALLSYGPNSKAQAAGNGSDTPPVLEPPADLGDLCMVGTCGESAAEGRALCDRHADLGTSESSAQREEDELSAFEFSSAPAGKQPEEVQPCPGPTAEREGALVQTSDQHGSLDLSTIYINGGTACDKVDYWLIAR